MLKRICDRKGCNTVLEIVDERDYCNFMEEGKLDFRFLLLLTKKELTSASSTLKIPRGICSSCIAELDAFMEGAEVVKCQLPPVKPARKETDYPARYPYPSTTTLEEAGKNITAYLAKCKELGVRP